MITSLTPQKTIGRCNNNNRPPLLCFIHDIMLRRTLTQKEFQVGTGRFAFWTEYARLAGMVAFVARSRVIRAPVRGRCMEIALVYGALRALTMGCDTFERQGQG